jgi:hypothetical protein
MLPPCPVSAGEGRVGVAQHFDGLTILHAEPTPPRPPLGARGGSYVVLKSSSLLTFHRIQFTLALPEDFIHLRQRFIIAARVLGVNLCTSVDPVDLGRHVITPVIVAAKMGFETGRIPNLAVADFKPAARQVGAGLEGPVAFDGSHAKFPRGGGCQVSKNGGECRSLALSLGRKSKKNGKKPELQGAAISASDVNFGPVPSGFRH